MKRLHFNEVDLTRLSKDRSIPVETVIDLLCATESALTTMMASIEGMAKTMDEIERLQRAWLPEMTDQLKKTRKDLNDNTNRGIAQAQEVVKATGELVDELRASRPAETRVSQDT